MQNIRGSELPRAENLPLLHDTILDVVEIWDCPRMHITVMNEPSTNGHWHMCFGGVGNCTHGSHDSQAIW
jgi:hypothetical protein